MFGSGSASIPVMCLLLGVAMFMNHKVAGEIAERDAEEASQREIINKEAVEAKKARELELHAKSISARLNFKRQQRAVLLDENVHDRDQPRSQVRHLRIKELDVQIEELESQMTINKPM